MSAQQLSLFGPPIRPKPYRAATPHNATGTSQTAAESVKPVASELERRVYEYLAVRGAVGATDEQIQNALHMDGNTERPRRVGLERKGYVIDSRLKRHTSSGRLATVWVVTGKRFPLTPKTKSKGNGR